MEDAHQNYYVLNYYNLDDVTHIAQDPKLKWHPYWMPFRGFLNSYIFYRKSIGMDLHAIISIKYFF